MAAKRPVRKRYHAAPIRQALRFNGALIGCTDTCMAMLVDAATLGGCIVTEKDVRELSNETRPDPASPGLNLVQLDAVARKLNVVFDNRAGDGWAALETALGKNQRVVAQLWYADMGGTPIGHAYYVEKIVDGRARVVDPMKGVYSTVSANRLRQAMQTFANKANLANGLLWGCSRPTPWVSVNQKPSADA